MIIESKRDIIENSRFEVDFKPIGFKLCNHESLNSNVSYIRLDTDQKLITIELFYTREVFKLNKLLQKGAKFNLKYITIKDGYKNVVFNGNITVDDLTVNISKQLEVQSTVTLYCTYGDL
jgi:hypothetical protein